MMHGTGLDSGSRYLNAHFFVLLLLVMLLDRFHQFIHLFENDEYNINR